MNVYSRMDARTYTRTHLHTHLPLFTTYLYPSSPSYNTSLSVTKAPRSVCSTAHWRRNLSLSPAAFQNMNSKRKAETWKKNRRQLVSWHVDMRQIENIPFVSHVIAHTRQGCITNIQDLQMVLYIHRLDFPCDETVMCYSLHRHTQQWAHQTTLLQRSFCRRGTTSCVTGGPWVSSCMRCS